MPLAATPATTPAPIVPLNATLAGAAAVQRLDVDEPRKSVAKITAPTRPALPAPPDGATAGWLAASADVIICVCTL